MPNRNLNTPREQPETNTPTRANSARELNMKDPIPARRHKHPMSNLKPTRQPTKTQVQHERPSPMRQIPQPTILMDIQRRSDITANSSKATSSSVQDDQGARSRQTRTQTRKQVRTQLSKKQTRYQYFQDETHKAPPNKQCKRRIMRTARTVERVSD